VTPNADTGTTAERLWAAGRGRCMYCIEDDALFHSACDCFYHDKVCNIAGCLGKDGPPPNDSSEP